MTRRLNGALFNNCWQIYMFCYGLRFFCCLSCWVVENIVKFLGHVDYYLFLGYPYVAIIKYVCCRRKSPIVICWIVIIT
jgi:hypothetical protein